MFRTFYIAQDERALLLRRGDFVDVLRPGDHVRFDPLRRYAVERFNVADACFHHRFTNYIMNARPAIAQREFHVIRTGAAEVVVRYQDGALAEVLPPNTRALYWKSYIDQRFERYDISQDFAIAPRLALELESARGAVFLATEGVTRVEVPEYHVGLLYVDGKLGPVLQPGAHYFWDFINYFSTELVHVHCAGAELH